MISFIKKDSCNMREKKENVDNYFIMDKQSITRMWNSKERKSRGKFGTDEEIQNGSTNKTTDSIPLAIPILCPLHNHCRVKYFCKQCQKPVCIVCKLGAQHKGHKMKACEPSKGKRRHKEETAQDSCHSVDSDESIGTSGPWENMEDHITQLTKWIADIQRYLQVLQVKNDDTIKKITDHYQYLQAFIDRWYDKMLLTIDTYFNKEKSSMLSNLKYLQDKRIQYEDSAVLDDIDIPLQPVDIDLLMPANDQFNVILSLGVSLTYDMLGSVSTSHHPAQLQNFSFLSRTTNKETKQKQTKKKTLKTDLWKTTLKNGHLKTGLSKSLSKLPTSDKIPTCNNFITCKLSSSLSSLIGPLSSPLLRIPQPCLHVIGPGRHVCSFETRLRDDIGNKQLSDSNCHQYSASSLSIMNNRHLLVADIGNDSVREFSSHGRFLSELDTMPGDQPSAAIETIRGDIIVATRNGAVLFTKPFGADTKWQNQKPVMQDITCPQTITSLSHGNITITDLANENISIVTYRSDLHMPVHAFHSGSYTNPYHAFHKPWYITNFIDSTLENDLDLASDQQPTNKSMSQTFLIMSDLADHTIKVYTSQGQYCWCAGGQGAAPGKLYRPAGLTMDRYGHILVADSGNNRIQAWTKYGKWLSVIIDEHDDLDTPMDVKVDPINQHLVILQANGTVKRFQYIF